VQAPEDPNNPRALTNGPLTHDLRRKGRGIIRRTQKEKQNALGQEEVQNTNKNTQFGRFLEFDLGQLG
jgi:hypothetical protein